MATSSVGQAASRTVSFYCGTRYSIVVWCRIVSYTSKNNHSQKLTIHQAVFSTKWLISLSTIQIISQILRAIRTVYQYNIRTRYRLILCLATICPAVTLFAGMCAFCFSYISGFIKAVHNFHFHIPICYVLLPISSAQSTLKLFLHAGWLVRQDTTYAPGTWYFEVQMYSSTGIRILTCIFVCTRWLFYAWLYIGDGYLLFLFLGVLSAETFVRPLLLVRLRAGCLQSWILLLQVCVVICRALRLHLWLACLWLKLCVCCLHIEPFFLPNDTSSTPSVRADSSS